MTRRPAGHLERPFVERIKRRARSGGGDILPKTGDQDEAVGEWDLKKIASQFVDRNLEDTWLFHRKSSY